MQEKDMQTFVSGIEKKLGKENAGIIADDLGILITDNKSMLDSMMKVENDLKLEREKSEKLTRANSSLLMQVGNYVAEGENEESNAQEKTPETFKDVSFSEFFDSKGRFIR